ncbi:MAG TPA: DUF1800 family protein [Pirellulaceae bacterium]
MTLRKTAPATPTKIWPANRWSFFTLGIGHYTEHDVKEAARALTGWTIRQGEFRDQPAVHDDGEKEILGRADKWTGDDLISILLEQPATARRIAWRLTNEFFGEGVVTDAAIDELAARLRQDNLNIHNCVETILHSELFFSSPNIASRIADPVSFLIGPLRALECWRQSPSTLVLAEWVSRMGQDLFYPPNVGGWSGSRAWLSTRTTIARANCLAALATGNLSSPTRPPDFAALASQYISAKQEPKTINFLSQLLRGRNSNENHSTSLDLLTSTEAHLH